MPNAQIAFMSLVVRNSDLISSRVDSDVVMMSFSKGEYYGISGVGSRIWELLETPTTVGHIVEKLCEEYEVEDEICRADVEEFVDRLDSLGLLSKA